MKKLFVKSLKYIVSICLIIFYFLILFKSININVPLEYKMYYVQKELTEWPGVNGLDYSLNDTIMFGEKYKDNLAKGIGTGWNDIEEDGRWTQDNAKLYLRLKEKVNEDKTLKLVLGHINPNTNVHILVNNKQIDSFRTIEGRNEYEFKIPKDTFNDELLCFNFKIENCKEINDTNNSNKSILAGIFVESISLS